MKALKTVTAVAATLTVVALYLLNLPTRASLFGLPTATFVAALLPLVPLGLMAFATFRSDLRTGLAGAGTALLLAAAATVPTLSAGTVLFVLSLLLFVETLTAGHRFASFEREAKAAGAELPLTAADASRQYLRFAWLPLLVTGAVTTLAVLAPLALPAVGAPALYAEAVELTSAYGVALLGLTVLAAFALFVLAKTRIAALVKR